MSKACCPRDVGRLASWQAVRKTHNPQRVRILYPKQPLVVCAKCSELYDINCTTFRILQIHHTSSCDSISDQSLKEFVFLLTLQLRNLALTEPPTQHLSEAVSISPADYLLDTVFLSTHTMATVEQIQKSATAAAQSLIASDAKTTSMS